VHINGAAFTIVGITPRDFVGVNIVAPDFWIPLRLEPLVHPAHNWLEDREYSCCQLFARLADSVNARQAQAEMNAVAGRLRAQHDPRSDASKPVSVLVWRGSPFPLPLNRYGGLEFAIALIMCAAGLVLAVACANVGSLQLARARKRVNEIGTRLSLGASRGRVVRQLLTESALLGLLSGLMALVLTWGFTRALATRFVEAWPAGNGAVVFHVTPDAWTFAYVFAISLAAGAVFGLLPSLENSRDALATAFKANAGTSSVRSRRLQDLLVGIQVSVSLALMVSGSMFVRSAIRSLQTETGYDARRVIDLELQFPESYRDNHARKAAVAAELRARLSAISGVAQITSASPPGARHRRVTSVIADRSRPVQSPLYVSEVQPNYFETLGIPLILGRGLPSQSIEGRAVVSESAARRLWPKQEPIGHKLRLAGVPYEVVGVARDTRGTEFDGSDSQQIYLPLPERSAADTPLMIRTRMEPAQMTKAIDAALASVDPDLMATTATLDEMLRQTGPFIASSLAAAVAAPLGLFGLLLASMGIYGTVSYIVVLRTREVGIRIAVGAQKSDILRLILRESSRPVAAGLGIGILIAIGISYLLRVLFYGLGGIDGVSLAVVTALFAGITLLAAYQPSRRAMRIDPMSALRYE